MKTMAKSRPALLRPGIDTAIVTIACRSIIMDAGARGTLGEAARGGLPLNHPHCAKLRCSAAAPEPVSAHERHAKALRFRPRLDHRVEPTS